MTNWSPTLNTERPRYIAIADAIASDLAAGKLSTGERLPPQRELAWRLGVTVGTVTRAYQEAERRGLLVGEVGRGSYLRDPAGSRAVLPGLARGEPGILEMHVSSPPLVQEASDLDRAFAAIAADPNRTALLDYAPASGIPAHRQMGVDWLKRSGVEVGVEDVVLTAGAHAALIAVLSCVLHAGEHVFAEPLTYPTILPIARLLGLHLHPLQMDGEGLIPDSLEQACRTSPAKVLYVVPTLHNPTTVTLSAERRRALADIARRHDLTIIEDDIFRLLATDTPPEAIRNLAPERTYYITSLSKTLAPGLRVGFIAAPPGKAEHVAVQQLIGGSRVSGLTAEMARAWIESGTADRILGSIKGELAQRRLVALNVFARRQVRVEPGAMFCWLTVPEPWRASEFAGAALAAGIKVTPSNTFATGRRVDEQAVRICLGPPRTRDILKDGLKRLDQLIDKGPSESYRAIA